MEAQFAHHVLARVREDAHSETNMREGYPEARRFLQTHAAAEATPIGSSPRWRAVLKLASQVAATEAKNRLGAILDDAQREPIVIQRQDRDVAVLVSMAEFERIHSANVRGLLDLRNEIAAEAKRNGLAEKKLKALLKDEE